MTSHNITGEDRKRVILENDVAVSQSLLWRWQREFYAQRGLKVWTEDMIPHFITNNPFIAELYARIVFGFLCDCHKLHEKSSPGNSGQPVLRILELGAGTGKFAYLFLRQLTALLHANGVAPGAVRYRMVDCSQDLLETWRENSYLAEFSKKGILEFRLFQSGQEDEIASSGLARVDRNETPLVVIANYVFDSLPQDAFEIEEAELREALMTTSTGGGEGRDASLPDDPAAFSHPPLSQLKFSFRSVEVVPNHYADNSWNGILQSYLARLSHAKLPFPIGTLEMLRQLEKSADGELLVLAADKGMVHEEDLVTAQEWPAFEFHAPNCFSQMVNLDAVAKYFEANGGTALKPEKHCASLHICAFLRSRNGVQFPAATAAYEASRQAIGPDDLFALLAWLNAHIEEVSIPQALAVLRLSRWDPVALMRLFPIIVAQLRGLAIAKHDVRDAVMKVWKNHYPVNKDEQVLAFQCGVILLELGFFVDAFSMFEESRKILGPSASTSYNLGLCSLGLERSAEALAFMVEACELDPAFEPANASRAKLEQELAKR
jgi:hypothetical protein